ncbi:MAG: hypothetical protein MJ252_07085 [archaeon]|nr:hypothetical protein [archaeon]
MKEMKRKPQRYHPLSQKFFPHPGCSREVSRKLEDKRIQEENEALIKRLEERKYISGPYSFDRSETNYQKQLYYRAQILKRGSSSNPFLNYVTPREYQRNFITFYNSNKEDNLIGNKKRSTSGYKTNYNSTWANTVDTSNRMDSEGIGNKRNKIKIERIQIDADKI